MPIDPRIIQSINRGPSAVFQNTIANLRSVDEVRRQKAMAPIEQQLAQENLQQVQQLRQQQAQQNRIRSVVIGAAELQPFLKNGDIDGARQKLLARKATLQQQGVATQDTDQALQLLDTNPQLLAQRAGQAIQLGGQLGVFDAIGQQTPRQREFSQFSAMPEDTDQQRAAKRQFGQAIGAIAKRATVEERVTAQQQIGDVKVQQDVAKARASEEAKLSERIKAIPQEERVQFLSENRHTFQGDISESRNALEEIDRAIEIWETAPGTISGPLASRLPSLGADSQELESILAGLGVERLSSFKGATSERELATAFRAGASIEQDATAGIRRLKKQRRAIERSNDRLRSLLNESSALLRKEPQAQQPQGQAQQAAPQEFTGFKILSVE